MLLTVVLTLATVFAWVMVLLCARGMIPRNGFAGLRIPSTMASDDAWLRGHRAAQLPALIGAVLSVIGLLVSLFVPAGDALGLVLVVVGILISLVWGVVAAGRAAR